MEQVAQFFVDLAASQPWLIMVFTIIGVLRAIFKPLMSLAEAYVLATPSKDDDALLAKVEASGLFKTVTWLLDFFGSIKLPVAKAVVSPAPAVADPAPAPTPASAQPAPNDSSKVS